MKKYLFILALILIGNLKSLAQKHELGKVTIEELKEKIHPKDSSASAAILFEKGQTYFEYKQEEGWRIITEVEVRIKIYKKEGYDWANKQVSFYIGGKEKESVDFSKAVTYNLVNGGIEKTKLKSEGEFTETVNKYWGTKKIAMPNVKEGSILEYKYSITSPFYSTFPIWNFQSTIPIKYSEYATYIPEYFIYNTHRKGFIYPKEASSKVNKTITLNYKERTAASLAGKSGAQISYSSEDVLYFENQIKYTLDNIPAIKEEAFVNNIDNYTASVEYELSGKKMPNSMYESFSQTWEDVVKNIYEIEDFGNELRKQNYFEEDLKVILQGLNTNNEKIEAIFQFVKSRMNWNEYKGYLCDVGVKKAYEIKTGNVAEINLMLTAMLRRFTGKAASHSISAKYSINVFKPSSIQVH